MSDLHQCKLIQTFTLSISIFDLHQFFLKEQIFLKLIFKVPLTYFIFRHKIEMFY